MRVIHKDAVQGHAVPRQVLEARGPFDPYVSPPVEDIDPTPEFPYGATAQNGMQGVDLYECRQCGAVLRETQLDSHEC